MADNHLIVLDLDGTLLTNEKHISPRTKQVITKTKRKWSSNYDCHWQTLSCK